MPARSLERGLPSMPEAGQPSALDATGRLAAWSLELDVDRVPGEVVDQTRIVLADTLGVLLMASTRHAVQTAVEVLPLDGSDRGTVIGHGRGARPEIAAFINGIGGHDIELDDSHGPSLSHPAAVIMPAAIAAAETAGATYGDMLAGIIAGYDVQSRVSQAIGTSALHHRGFHPSAVCGAIGAAVTAGRILGLSIDEMRSCIGLAASQSSGLTTYYDDPYHMSKSFQTGIAARNGVTAALFAERGFGAAPDVLTGRHDMIHPFGAANADAGKLLLELGERWEITRTNLKRHACCNQTHAAVDALLDLIEEHAFEAEDIRSIDVQLSHDAVPGIDRNALWTHNIQYVMALAAYERFIGLDHFSPTWTSNPEITELSSHVTVRGNDDLQSRFPAMKGAIVTGETDGGTFEKLCEGPRGSPVRPLAPREIEDKFRRLAAAVLPGDAAGELWTSVTTLSAPSPAEDVIRVLAASPGQLVG
jgi:2-methylcitrate dehydratase PrpD